MVEASTTDISEGGSSVQTGAELRQLTVLFCDLVRSSELSRQMDPERMSALLRDYQNCVSGEIARYNGHVAKFMGDGVLAYFGWSSAHEDDVEQAVRSGLAVISAVQRLTDPAGTQLQSHVGIATGLVVVGDLVGNEEARERVVTGETPNLAARLQEVANPNSLLVSEVTAKLCRPAHWFRGWFERWRFHSDKLSSGRLYDGSKS
ncbi:MAG: adenylate/guanylate cyclase domain-containing protein [Hyphomicrobiales bacterium]